MHTPFFSCISSCIVLYFLATMECKTIHQHCVCGSTIELHNKRCPKTALFVHRRLGYNQEGLDLVSLPIFIRDSRCHEIPIYSIHHLPLYIADGQLSVTFVCLKESRWNYCSLYVIFKCLFLDNVAGVLSTHV